MTTPEIESDWNTMEDNLMDEDLQFIEGQQDLLLGQMRERTGLTREEVEKAIKEYRAALVS